MTHDIDQKSSIDQSNLSSGLMTQPSHINGHCDSSRDGSFDETMTSNTRSSLVDDGLVRRKTTTSLFGRRLPPKPPVSTSTTVPSTYGNEETVSERIYRKSFYQRFNDDSGHSSPRFKSASPGSKRFSLLDGDDSPVTAAPGAAVNTNGSSFIRQGLTNNPSSSPTPGASGQQQYRSSYNSSISMLDRKDISNNSSSDWLSRIESKTNQMLSEMKNQMNDVECNDSTSNGYCHSDFMARRRSTSLLFSSTKNITNNSRPNSSYYSTLLDSDSDDDDDDYIPSTSLGMNYLRNNSLLTGSSSGGSSTGILNQINSTFI